MRREMPPSIPARYQLAETIKNTLKRLQLEIRPLVQSTRALFVSTSKDKIVFISILSPLLKCLSWPFWERTFKRNCVYLFRSDLLSQNWREHLDTLWSLKKCAIIAMKWLFSEIYSSYLCLWWLRRQEEMEYSLYTHWCKEMGGLLFLSLLFINNMTCH